MGGEERTTPESASRGVTLQYLATAAAWSASFLFIKVAVGGLTPFQVGMGRVVIGAIVLVGMMALSGRRWPRDPAIWRDLTIVSLLTCVLPLQLFAWAAQHLPSGLSSIYNATTPLTTMVASLFLLPEERLDRTRTLALFVAVGGIVLVAEPWAALSGATSSHFILGQGACLLATIGYGFGFSYLRRNVQKKGVDAITIAAAQVGIGAVILLAATPFLGMTRPTLDLPIVGSMLLLGAFGTGLAYVWYNNVIRAKGATLASTVTYLTPVGGVILGVLILGERFGWEQLVGGMIVIGAVVLSQLGGRKGRSGGVRAPNRERAGGGAEPRRDGEEATERPPRVTLPMP